MTQYLAAAAMARSGLNMRDVESFLNVKSEIRRDLDSNIGDNLLDFAKRTGAPLADLLEAAASYLATLHRQREELSTAMATPRASAKVMALLPLVAMFMTELLGFGNLAALLTPEGLALLALAGLLVWVGQRWSNRILSITQPPVAPGLLTMLTIAGLKAGLELQLVRFEAWRQLEPGANRELEFEQDRIDELLSYAVETGASATEVLRGLLGQIQTESEQQSRREVQQRAVRLMLPLGLTGLPAFMLVSVAPMLLTWFGV